MLLTGLDAATHTGHNNFVVRDGELPGYLFTVTGEVGAHLHVTLGFYLYVHYNATEKILLQ